MAAPALAFLAGTLAAACLPCTPPLALTVLVAAAGGVALGWHRTRRVAPLLLGMGFCLLTLAGDASGRLRPRDAERRLLDCRITTLPAASGLDTQFDADCRGAQRPGRTLRLRVSWSAAPVLHVGETWRVLAALRAPRASSNPGSADSLRALRRQRLHGFARVLASPLDRRLAAAGPGLGRLREHVADAIGRAVPERDAAALIAALAVGDTRRISAEQWRVFSATGLTHLIAISGLHVTLFGLIAAAFARRLWSASRWLVRHTGRESCALLAGLAAAAGYALLAGFSVPAQRTLIMLGAWCLTRLLHRPPGSAPPLALALVGVLLIDPLAPLAPGFWLSFAAVAALMVGAHTGGAGRGIGARLRALWRAQWIVAAALLPVTAAAFGTLSWAGLALNLVAIPLFTGVLVPLVLGGVAAGVFGESCARPWYTLAARLIEAAAPLLQAVADRDASLWHLAPPGWWYGLAAAALSLILLPWRPRLRLAGALALIPGLWPAPTGPAPGELALTLLDTGRGLALILRTERHALLYDVGESWRTDGAVSVRTLLPALRALRIERIDRLLVPRLDRARSAGVGALLAALPVDELAAGEAGPLPPEFQPCRAGEHWSWDGVQFELLAGRECVLRAAVAGGEAVLLTGELEPAGQRELVRRGLGPSAVVQLPRHGTAGGYEPALRAATRARVALVAHTAAGAAGRGVAATLAAWRDSGTVVRITGEEGAIGLRIHPALGIIPDPVTWEPDRRCGKSCVPAGR
ncbi:MAG: DNA internalization-related competence protein ComEC/Rec2 [Gammaproteobacteria bacterium]|nr:DNA internalization-related competence protein ComEC/Rec2 [Gammaproteobacteria bacterium]